MKHRKTHQTHVLPVSVKGIVLESGYVWLRKNERNEWELPGGKLDKGEQPEETVKRELYEELGFTVEVQNLTLAYMHSIPGSIDESQGVLILAYVCQLFDKTGELESEGEAGQANFKKFPIDVIKDLNMPHFYKEAILRSRP